MFVDGGDAGAGQAQQMLGLFPPHGASHRFGCYPADDQDQDHRRQRQIVMQPAPRPEGRPPSVPDFAEAPEGQRDYGRQRPAHRLDGNAGEFQKRFLIECRRREKRCFRRDETGGKRIERHGHSGDGQRLAAEARLVPITPQRPGRPEAAGQSQSVANPGVQSRRPDQSAQQCQRQRQQG